MTMLQLPGVNISILRQQTFSQRGVPLLISGRVTALGLPVPALVRVSLEGPTFAPEITNFDTFAAPTGDYAVPIIADQDGQFTVTARAFPPVALPISLPGLPSPIDILPPVAESPSPPIVIGERINGTVAVDGERVPVPPQSPIEITSPISVAPFIPITISLPGAAGGPGAAPTPFAPLAPPLALPPTTALPPPAEVPEAGRVGAQVVDFELEG